MDRERKHVRPCGPFLEGRGTVLHEKSSALHICWIKCPEYLWLPKPRRYPGLTRLHTTSWSTQFSTVLVEPALCRPQDPGPGPFPLLRLISWESHYCFRVLQHSLESCQATPSFPLSSQSFTKQMTKPQEGEAGVWDEKYVARTCQWCDSGE